MTNLSLFTRISRDVMTLTLLAVPVLVTLAPATARADEPAAAPTAAPATAPIGPPVASTAVVELAADDGRATIERRVGGMSPSALALVETGVLSVGQWEQACTSPCVQKLDTRYSYRIAGDGLVPTESFGLPHGGDRVRVEAKMGSATGRVAGVLTTGVGVGAMALGALALAATPILHSEDVGSEGLRTGVLAGGISAVSLGAVALGIGAYLWFTNGSTAHTQVASR